MEEPASIEKRTGDLEVKVGELLRLVGLLVESEDKGRQHGQLGVGLEVGGLAMLVGGIFLLAGVAWAILATGLLVLFVAQGFDDAQPMRRWRR